MKKILITLLALFTLIALSGCQSDYDNGYDRGSEDGYRKGYNEGKEEGRQSGIEAGKEMGYAEGQQSTDAYQKGFRAGEQSGRYDKLDLEDPETIDDMLYYIWESYPDEFFEFIIDKEGDSLRDYYYEYFDEDGMIKDEYDPPDYSDREYDPYG